MTLLNASPITLYGVAGIVGLFVGSFLNVVIHRLPIMMERRWQLECAELTGSTPPEQATYNLFLPRSRCPSCNSLISALENIPVLSWMFLGGKCRHCATAISVQYPLVELSTAIFCIAVATQFGATVETATAIIFTFSLVALSGIDFKTTLLPDDITLPLLWLGLLCNVFNLFTSLQSAVIGAILGYLVLWSIYHLFRLLTGKEGMGYGDFKLLAALGAWLGWEQLPLVILLSSLLGAIVGVTLIIVRGRDRNIPIPFGPYLAGAGWVSLLWGETIVQYYLRFSVG